MQDLAVAAREAGKTNVAFLANFLLQNVDACIDILTAAGRAPEAAFFARAYRPSRVDELVKLWQADLKKVNAKAAESLASPAEYPNLFPDWEIALKVLPTDAYIGYSVPQRPDACVQHVVITRMAGSAAASGPFQRHSTVSDAG